jgi:hypothetical protein
MNDGGHRMVKYGAAAVILALYTAISAWIVAGEGKAYREAIARKSNPPVSTTVDNGPVEESVKSIAPEPEPAPEPSSPLAPVKEPKAAPAHPVRTPSPEPAHSPEPSGHASPPSPAPAVAKARHLDPFWKEPDQEKVWDFDSFTVKDERELGAALHRMVLHDHAEIDSGPLQKRLEDAAKPYLAACSRKDGSEYTFTVLDCPRLNVFSHPGGYIYVCKGLFDWIAEDEDYALGFILAHEIAHVDMEHAIACVRDPDVKKNFKFGSALLFYAVVIPGGYLKPQEQAADDWATRQMLKAGRSRYETLAFLRRLEDYAKSHGFENKRKTPIDPPPVPILDNHIRAHPIPRARLEEVKAIIDRLQKI